MHMPRRQFVQTVTSLAVPLLTSRLAFGERQPEGLAITVADSILSYRLLLAKAWAEAESGLAHETVKDLQDCEELLSSLRDALGKLRVKLETSPRKADWPAIQNQFSAMEHNLILIQGRPSVGMSPDLINEIPVSAASLASLLREVASDCDLDPKGEIRKLVDKVCDAIDKQNEVLKKYAINREKWSEEIDRFEKLYTSCDQSLGSAAISLALAAEGKSPIAIDDARKFLEAAKAQLEGFPAPTTSLATSGVTAEGFSARDTLDRLLMVVIASLNTAPVPAGASFAETSGNNPGAGLRSASLDKSNATLIEYVRAVVQNPAFFSPGVTIQIINCILVCWPVWLFYLADNEAPTRQRLIASALKFGLCPGALPPVGQVANQLQDVYLKASRSQA
jgi:hypothetical protein